MDYFVTVKTKLGSIREEMIRELQSLVKKVNFGDSTDQIKHSIFEKFLNCRHFKNVTLLLTADQVVRIYNEFKHTDITGLTEKDFHVEIDLTFHGR